MSAARAVAPAPAFESVMAWQPRTFHGGECYLCHAGQRGASVALHAITMLCERCHVAEQAAADAGMREDQAWFAARDKDRREHVETCHWCAKASEITGRMPAAYQCVNFGRPRVA